ncbi:hypothetical protein Tco_1177236 [Tanacetum coccineum]
MRVSAWSGKTPVAKGTPDGKKKRDSIYPHQESREWQDKKRKRLRIEEFTRPNNFKGVPHPLSGDYTPKPQEEIDDSLYVYGSCGNTSEHSFETESESLSEPNEMSKSSLSHLIKDYDYYEKKMAREAEVKKVVNTGNWMEKPVWTKANRVNHSNKFVPRSVQLNAGRPNFNSVRPNINAGRPNFNSVRPNINNGRTNINSVKPKVNAVSSNANTVRSRQPEHPLKNMVDRGIFDSGCSGHMTDLVGYSFWLLRMKLVAYFRPLLGRLKTSLVIGLKSLDQITALNLRIEMVKIIRSDNGTEFKNRDMLEFCGNKGNKTRVQKC